MTPRSNFSTDTRRVIMAFSKDRFLSKSRFDSNVELKRLFVGIAVPFQRVIGFLQESMDSLTESTDSSRVNRLFQSQQGVIVLLVGVMHSFNVKDGYLII